MKRYFGDWSDEDISFGHDTTEDLEKDLQGAVVLIAGPSLKSLKGTRNEKVQTEKVHRSSR